MGLKINGSTSGSIEIDVPAVAGTDTSITIPAKNGGTFIVEESTGNIDLGPLDINGSASDDSVNIDSSGRLLVGETSSTQAGSIDAKAQVVSSDYNAALTVRRNQASDGAPGMLFCKSRGTSNSANVVVNSGDGLGNIRFFGADATGGNDFAEAAAISCVVDGTPGSDDMPGRLEFKTTSDGASSPTERMRLDSNGYLTLYKNSSNLSRLNFNASSTRLEYSDNSGNLTFYTNSSARVYVGYGGGFRPASDNSQPLGGTGNRWTAVYAVSGTIQTSDLREKTDVADSVLGSDFIKQLRPVSYKWHVGENVITKAEDGETDVVTPRPGKRTHWGFIAQEVKQAVDDAGVDFGGWILTDKDDPDSSQGLRYDQFIAPLTKALQEALAKIETLETANASLEARLTALEGGAS